MWQSTDCQSSLQTNHNKQLHIHAMRCCATQLGTGNSPPESEHTHPDHLGKQRKQYKSCQFPHTALPANTNLLNRKPLAECLGRQNPSLERQAKVVQCIWYVHSRTLCQQPERSGDLHVRRPPIIKYQHIHSACTLCVVKNITLIDTCGLGYLLHAAVVRVTSHKTCGGCVNLAQMHLAACMHAVSVSHTDT